MNVLLRDRLASPVNRISSASVAGGRNRIFQRAFLKAGVLIVGLAVGIVALFTTRVAKASSDDKKIVTALDTQYQEAVKKNDATTMDRLLADDFVLVTGSGKSYTKADLLDEARSEQIHYEHQEDTDQTVRIWGDTAVITAKLWEKGTNQGKSFDKTVWFSDIYVRTRTGWQYVFGQSSFPLQIRVECRGNYLRSGQLHGKTLVPGPFSIREQLFFVDCP
jgi:ketosteroid isomerase-like protein